MPSDAPADAGAAGDHGDEPTEPSARWGLAEPSLALLLGIVGSAVGQGVAATATGADVTDVTIATVVGSLVGMWAAYLLVIALTVSSKGSGRPARDDVGFRARIVDLPLGVVAGVVSSVVVVNLVYFFLQLGGVLDDADVEKLDDPAKELAEIAEGRSFIVLAIFVGIGAPIVEELFFRGFLQPAAIRRFGAVAGVIFTAVVFGAVHFQLLQFPALAVFGVILGLLAHRSGRLGPGIVAHMVFNGLTLAALAAS